MEGDIAKYRDSGTVETLRANLEGAKYTLAVPKYVYDAGVKSFADLAKHAEEFKHRIYGIEPGNDGNRLIQSMIDKNALTLNHSIWLNRAKRYGVAGETRRAPTRVDRLPRLGATPNEQQR